MTVTHQLAAKDIRNPTPPTFITRLNLQLQIEAEMQIHGYCKVIKSNIVTRRRVYKTC